MLMSTDNTITCMSARLYSPTPRGHSLSDIINTYTDFRLLLNTESAAFTVSELSIQVDTKYKSTRAKKISFVCAIKTNLSTSTDLFLYTIKHQSQLEIRSAYLHIPLRQMISNQNLLNAKTHIQLHG